MRLTPVAIAARMLGSRAPDVPPIVIGATGGSGSRAAHGILTAAGLFMGRRLNGAGDAMDFEPYLNAFINPILEAVRTLDYRLDDLPPRLRDRALAGLRGAARTHLFEYRGGPWGWKNPRSMYVLPLIHALHPDFRFLHLVRDGRDMAFSFNQNQPRKHFRSLTGAPPDPGDPARAAVLLWDRANRTAADWGERTLGARYLCVRYEDLCRAPAATVAEIFRRFELPPARLEAAAACVVRPDSLGRWRGRPAAETAALTEAACEGLRRFGYLD